MPVATAAAALAMRACPGVALVAGVKDIRWNTVETSLVLMYEKLVNRPDYANQCREINSGPLPLHTQHEHHRQLKRREDP